MNKSVADWIAEGEDNLIFFQNRYCLFSCAKKKTPALLRRRGLGDGFRYEGSGLRGGDHRNRRFFMVFRDCDRVAGQGIFLMEVRVLELEDELIEAFCEESFDFIKGLYLVALVLARIIA